MEFRGNVQTRLRKLEEGVADATFLAMAGLKRLGMVAHIQSPISENDILPAVAQGAIGVQRRTDDTDMAAKLSAISHAQTTNQLRAERSFLKALDGSCQTPIAGLATLSGQTLSLRGEILRPDGSEVIKGEKFGPIAEAEKIGESLAAELLSQTDGAFF